MGKAQAENYLAGKSIENIYWTYTKVLIKIISFLGAVLGIFGFLSGFRSLPEFLNSLKGDINIYSENITYTNKNNTSSMLNLTCQLYKENFITNNCEILIDNAFKYTAPLDGLIIDAGDHTLSVKMTGYIGEHANIFVPSGANLVLNFLLFKNNVEGAEQRKNHKADLSLTEGKKVAYKLLSAFSIGLLIYNLGYFLALYVKEQFFKYGILYAVVFIGLSILLFLFQSFFINHVKTLEGIIVTFIVTLFYVLIHIATMSKLNPIR